MGGFLQQQNPCQQTEILEEWLDKGDVLSLNQVLFQLKSSQMNNLDNNLTMEVNVNKKTQMKHVMDLLALKYQNTLA